MLRHGRLIPRFRRCYDAPEGIGTGRSVNEAEANLLRSLNRNHSGKRFADGVIFSTEVRKGAYEARARLLSHRYTPQITEHDLLVPAGIEPHVMILDTSYVGKLLANLLKGPESYVLHQSTDPISAKRVLEIESAVLDGLAPTTVIKRRPLLLVTNHEIGTTLAKYHMRDFWKAGIEGCILFGYLTKREEKSYESLGVKITIPLEQFNDPVSYIASKLGRFCLEG